MEPGEATSRRGQAGLGGPGGGQGFILRGRDATAGLGEGQD